MSVNINDITRPADTDPIGSPSNGIQVEMRNLKKSYQDLRNDRRFGTPDSASPFALSTSGRIRPDAWPATTFLTSNLRNVASISYNSGYWVVNLTKPFPTTIAARFNVTVQDIGSTLGAVQEPWVHNLWFISASQFVFSIRKASTPNAIGGWNVNTLVNFDLEVQPS